MYALSSLATVLILVALSVLDYFEAFLPRLHYRTVSIRTAWKPGCVPEAVDKFKSGGLRVVEAYFDRDQDLKFADIHLRKHRDFENILSDFAEQMLRSGFRFGLVCEL